MGYGDGDGDGDGDARRVMASVGGFAGSQSVGSVVQGRKRRRFAREVMQHRPITQESRVKQGGTCRPLAGTTQRARLRKYGHSQVRHVFPMVEETAGARTMMGGPAARRA
jgi:hypothetical protein